MHSMNTPSPPQSILVLRTLTRHQPNPTQPGRALTAAICSSNRGTTSPARPCLTRAAITKASVGGCSRCGGVCELISYCHVARGWHGSVRSEACMAKKKRKRTNKTEDWRRFQGSFCFSICLFFCLFNIFVHHFLYLLCCVSRSYGICGALCTTRSIGPTRCNIFVPRKFPGGRGYGYIWYIGSGLGFTACQVRFDHNVEDGPIRSIQPQVRSVHDLVAQLGQKCSIRNSAETDPSIRDFPRRPGLRFKRAFDKR